MKIAILTSFYPSTVLSEEECQKYALKKGHTFPWITNLAEGLAKFDSNDVHVITICNEFGKDFSYVKNKVTYNFLQSTNRFLRRLTLFESDKHKLIKFFNQERFDIVHGQGFEKYGYFAVTSKLPNVLTIHLYNSTPVKNFFLYDKFSIIGLWNAIILKIYQKVIMTNIKNIISISPFIRKAVENEHKGITIYDIENAVSPAFFQADDLKNESFILYVGSLGARKSVLDLLEAVKKVDKAKLKIVSNTENGHYCFKMRRFVEENDLVNRVEFLGPRKNIEILDILMKCSFVVVPSKKESAPMVISEAMTVGKPVIATKVDGIPYMIVDGKTGFLVEVGDVQKLAEKMDLLLSDSELCERMGKNAHKEAVKRWHPAIVASNTIEVYKKIMTNHN